MEGILLNASKYAVTTWYNDKMNFDAQTGNILNFGGTDEGHIRPSADMVFALAVSIKLGVYDASYTGVKSHGKKNYSLPGLSSQGKQQRWLGRFMAIRFMGIQCRRRGLVDVG